MEVIREVVYVLSMWVEKKIQNFQFLQIRQRVTALQDYGSNKGEGMCIDYVDNLFTPILLLCLRWTM